jgi:hypothetical protein
MAEAVDTALELLRHAVQEHLRQYLPMRQFKNG